MGTSRQLVDEYIGEQDTTDEQRDDDRYNAYLFYRVDEKGRDHDIGGAPMKDQSPKEALADQIGVSPSDLMTSQLMKSPDQREYTFQGYPSGIKDTRFWTPTRFKVVKTLA